jgi:hypothetical protein
MSFGTAVSMKLEEPQELLVAVPAVMLGDQRPAGQVVGREQADRAVADVVVRAALRRRRQHRQARGGPVQGLGICDFSSDVKSSVM